MDFLDPKKKRAHKIRLIVGYILIGIAISLVTLILIFQSYGYDLDRKTGAIIQNGLVFVASQPVASDVYLNGRQYATQSDARLVLPANIYNLELKRNGYRDWKRTFSLAGGTIERFVYPFLFPNKLDTTDRQAYATAPSFATQSPDRHWILIQRLGQLASFDLFDANDFSKAPTVVTVPANVFATSDTHQLKVIEWANDNRHVLVQHNFAGGTEFVVIDVEDGTQSFNVNRTVNRTPTAVTLRDKKFDHFYLYDQAKRTLDYAEQKNPTVQPVLANVLGYESHGDDVLLYASSENAPAGKARIMLKDNDGSFFVREVAESPTYLLALARYDSRWYVAAGGSAEGRVYVYKDPQSVIKQSNAKTAIPVSVLRVDNPAWLEFSANTQFIALQGGQNFAVYDAENDQDYRYTITEPIDQTNPAVSWMDGHRILAVSQGKMLVFDYDGINVQSLAGNIPGVTPFFDRDYKLMYNLGPGISNPSQFSLSKTDLRVAN